jgi:pyrroloquinoline quinone biosynthesis protein E
MPRREQVVRAKEIAEERIQRYKGRMQMLFVLPDYFEDTPKACYGGWGRFYIVVSPDGKALPCHGAYVINSLEMPNVREHSMEWIWHESPAFNAFRGDSWVKEPCPGGPDKAETAGGCRCQAMALTGDATNADPVCSRSPYRYLIDAALLESEGPAEYVYRQVPAAPAAVPETV